MALATPPLMDWLDPPRLSYCDWMARWALAASSGVLYLTKCTSGRWLEFWRAALNFWARSPMSVCLFKT
uniref:IP08465p n=1 Tax=Drosophila melanogaster TaxID=7227 RepID=Q4V4L2_DROME|nr:IP08465p [Drosophila melanogaster]